MVAASLSRFVSMVGLGVGMLFVVFGCLGWPRNRAGS